MSRPVDFDRILDSLLDRGFDLSYVTVDEDDDDRPDSVRVRCSQCDALVISGVACHETGCPRQSFECKGCDARVSRSDQYCDSCNGVDSFEAYGEEGF